MMLISSLVLWATIMGLLKLLLEGSLILQIKFQSTISIYDANFANFVLPTKPTYHWFRLICYILSWIFIALDLIGLVYLYVGLLGDWSYACLVNFADHWSFHPSIIKLFDSMERSRRRLYRYLLVNLIFM